MNGTAHINSSPYPFEHGESIYSYVCRHLGKDAIPVLCHDDRLEPFGSCRICSVDVGLPGGGPRRVMASCHTLVEEGQHIDTDTPRIEALRRSIVELLLSDIPPESLVPANGEKFTVFQDLVRRLGVSGSRFPRGKPTARPDHGHPYIRFDEAECIACYRCIRACDEIQGELALSMHGRGYRSRVISSRGGSLENSECISCGRCVQTCPTNALSDLYRAKTLEPEKSVRTVCTYCGVGCNLDVHLVSGEIRAMTPACDAEVNAGHACVKGRYAFAYVNHPDRLKTPLLRKNGDLVPVSWDEALDHTAERLLSIMAQHGAQAIGGVSSSRCTNEENFLMQKFVRVVLGSNNIDGCARVCHAPTAFGMRRTYGTGAATNSIDEMTLADCLLVVGANVTEGHPVTGARIRQQSIKGTPLIVIDPRRIELARHATVHLQLRPGTNVALLGMLARYIIEEGLVDDAFVGKRTEGFDEFRKAALEVDLDEMERITGVGRKEVREAARIYGRAGSAMAFHGLGLTEHYQGSRAVMMLASIVMMTGNIGRPGVGLNPLRGQNNVQGAADMGVQPDLGPGYLDISDASVRAHYARHYGRPVPADRGLTMPEMFNAAVDGTLKALWIMGQDVLQTDPNTTHVRNALSNLEFLAVQEIFMTETTRLASVVFPASSHLEKSGTFTNGERRIQRVNRVIPALEGTRADGQIVVDIMNRMGYSQEGYDPPIHLEEIANVVPFFAGVSWDTLGENGKQWPVAADGKDTKILHVGKFKRGKGRFVFTSFEETPELQGGDMREFPFILTTGRRLEHYNCGSMTRRTPNIELMTCDVLLVNPDDAERLGISSGDTVLVRSRQGETRLAAEVSGDVRPGVVFTTFHFPEVAVNQLTSGVLDRDAMTPEFKVTAVSIRRG